MLRVRGRQQPCETCFGCGQSYDFCPKRILQILRAAFHNDEAFQKPVLGSGVEDAAVVDQGNVICNSFQIRGDVRGKQYGLLSV